jgi:hypothetical protein
MDTAATSGDHVFPQLKGFQNVRFIHRRRLSRWPLEGHMGDALDFRAEVTHGVNLLRCLKCQMRLCATYPK